MTAQIYTHKTEKWTRQSLADGSGCFRVTPTDDSGERIVRFLSAHSWQNDPSDDKANQGQDRVVLVSGEPLPAWAIDWLTKAAVKSFDSGRRAFRAACDQADFDADMRDAWSY